MSPNGIVRAFTSSVQITSRGDIAAYSIVVLLFSICTFLGIVALIETTTVNLAGGTGIVFLFFFAAFCLLPRAIFTLRAYISLVRTAGHTAVKGTVTNVEMLGVFLFSSSFKVYSYPFVTVESAGKTYSIFFMQENIDASALMGCEVLIRLSGKEGLIKSLADGSDYRKFLT